ncbi:MAG TPA: hypothetical protein VGK99_13165 [Acidobacteriota bacterium]
MAAIKLRLGQQVDTEPAPVRSVEIFPCHAPVRFLNLQREFYRGDPNYVPPLTLVDRWRITPWTSAFLRRNEVGFFVARSNGHAVGRISVARNRAHDEYYGDRVGFFGHFEARDGNVAHALLDHAAAWLHARGASAMRGPVDLSTNYRCGLLVKGDPGPPTVMMPYNPPEYRNYLESYGLAEVKRLLAFRLKKETLNLVELTAFVKKLRQRTSLSVRPVRYFRKDMRLIAAIYNRIWSRNWGFAPMSRKEFLQETAGLALVCPPDLFQIAFAGEEPIGLAVALPDHNPAIQACDGRLLPIGWWKFFRELRRARLLRVIMLGVVPEHRRSGADSLMLYELSRKSLARGFEEFEAGWILEDNHVTVRILERIGGTVKRRYSIFEMGL